MTNVAYSSLCEEAPFFDLPTHYNASYEQNYNLSPNGIGSSGSLEAGLFRAGNSASNMLDLFFDAHDGFVMPEGGLATPTLPAPSALSDEDMIADILLSTTPPRSSLVNHPGQALINSLNLGINASYNSATSANTATLTNFMEYSTSNGSMHNSNNIYNNNRKRNTSTSSILSFTNFATSPGFLAGATGAFYGASAHAPNAFDFDYNLLDDIVNLATISPLKQNSNSYSMGSNSSNNKGIMPSIDTIISNFNDIGNTTDGKIATKLDQPSKNVSESNPTNVSDILDMTDIAFSGVGVFRNDDAVLENEVNGKLLADSPTRNNGLFDSRGDKDYPQFDISQLLMPFETDYQSYGGCGGGLKTEQDVISLQLELENYLSSSCEHISNNSSAGKKTPSSFKTLYEQELDRDYCTEIIDDYAELGSHDTQQSGQENSSSSSSITSLCNSTIEDEDVLSSRNNDLYASHMSVSNNSPQDAPVLTTKFNKTLTIKPAKQVKEPTTTTKSNNKAKNKTSKSNQALEKAYNEKNLVINTSKISSIKDEWSGKLASPNITLLKKEENEDNHSEGGHSSIGSSAHMNDHDYCSYSHTPRTASHESADDMYACFNNPADKSPARRASLLSTGHIPNGGQSNLGQRFKNNIANLAKNLPAFLPNKRNSTYDSKPFAGNGKISLLKLSNRNLSTPTHHTNLTDKNFISLLLTSAKDKINGLKTTQNKPQDPTNCNTASPTVPVSNNRKRQISTNSLTYDLAAALNAGGGKKFAPHWINHLTSLNITRHKSNNNLFGNGVSHDPIITTLTDKKGNVVVLNNKNNNNINGDDDHTENNIDDLNLKNINNNISHNANNNKSNNAHGFSFDASTLLNNTSIIDSNEFQSSRICKKDGPDSVIDKVADMSLPAHLTNIGDCNGSLEDAVVNMGSLPKQSCPLLATGKPAPLNLLGDNDLSNINSTPDGIGALPLTPILTAALPPLANNLYLDNEFLAFLDDEHPATTAMADNDKGNKKKFNECSSEGTNIQQSNNEDRASGIHKQSDRYNEMDPSGRMLINGDTLLVSTSMSRTKKSNSLPSGTLFSTVSSTADNKKSLTTKKSAPVSSANNSNYSSSANKTARAFSNLTQTARGLFSKTAGTTAWNDITLNELNLLGNNSLTKSKPIHNNEKDKHGSDKATNKTGQNRSKDKIGNENMENVSVTESPKKTEHTNKFESSSASCENICGAMNMIKVFPVNPWETTVDDLKSMFKKFGLIDHIKISERSAFITYKNARDATTAIRRGSHISGTKFNVSNVFDDKTNHQPMDQGDKVSNEDALIKSQNFIKRGAIKLPKTRGSDNNLIEALTKRGSHSTEAALPFKPNKRSNDDQVSFNKPSSSKPNASNQITTRALIQQPQTSIKNYHQNVASATSSHLLRSPKKSNSANSPYNQNASNYPDYKSSGYRNPQQRSGNSSHGRKGGN